MIINNEIKTDTTNIVKKASVIELFIYPLVET